MLVGEARFLRAIFEKSIRIENPSLRIHGKGSAYLQIQNLSDIDYELTGTDPFEEISLPKSLILRAARTVLLRVGGKSEDRSGTKRFTVSYTVTNLKIAPDAGLPVEFNIEVTFVAGEQ